MKNNKKTYKKHKFFRVFVIILICILSLILLCNVACFVKAETNYKHNLLAWNEYADEGIIDEQHKYENLRFGFGTVAKNGCGAMAVYNILFLEGKNPNFVEVIKKFDSFGENFFGLGGSKPAMVIKTLKKAGLKVNYSLNKSKFKDIAESSKYSIFLYVGIENWVPFGHYQLMLNFDGEKYETININGHYTLEEITNIDNTFLTMMIGVNV